VLADSPSQHFHGRRIEGFQQTTSAATRATLQSLLIADNAQCGPAFAGSEVCAISNPQPTASP